jgi:hypothetical protein
MRLFSMAIKSEFGTYWISKVKRRKTKCFTLFHSRLLSHISSWRKISIKTSENIIFSFPKILPLLFKIKFSKFSFLKRRDEVLQFASYLFLFVNPFWTIGFCASLLVILITRILNNLKTFLRSWDVSSTFFDLMNLIVFTLNLNFRKKDNILKTHISRKSIYPMI